jgi:hypothetical protein
MAINLRLDFDYQLFGLSTKGYFSESEEIIIIRQVNNGNHKQAYLPLSSVPIQNQWL